MNSILSTDDILKEFRHSIEDHFQRFVILYDQFGRPVEVPSTAPKIGTTITVKRPQRYRAA